MAFGLMRLKPFVVYSRAGKFGANSGFTHYHPTKDELHILKTDCQVLVQAHNTTRTHRLPTQLRYIVNSITLGLQKKHTVAKFLL
jgi:hypothetical protein